MLGSGSVVVMDSDTCPVRAAWRIAQFFHRESCGQCTPCREGSGWIEKIMFRIEQGLGREKDIDLVLDACDNISPGLPWPPKQTTICVLGPSIPSAIVSVAKMFRDELLVHVKDGAAPSRPIRCAMTDLAAAQTAISVTIDGRTVEAEKGELIIAAAERAGVFIPRFCYHPRMKSVGMCRMCLVEVSGPRGPSLQPACYVEVADGQEIVTDSPAARKAQEGVIEYLLLNHPLDCPVCDKGGECPLQDQSVSHGPGESRFDEEKRHWAKPIEIGPLVLLDRERCIQCARCTRFAEEVAGEAFIDFAERGDRIEVAIFPGQGVRLVFRGQHCADLPGGCPHLGSLPLQVPPVGPRAGRDDMHHVRRRLPHGRPVLGWIPRALPRCRLRARQPELAVRPGPFRLRGRAGARAPCPAPRAHRGRPGPDHLARGLEPSRRRPRSRRRGPGRGERRSHRRCPSRQRGRLCMGEAHQGRHRHRQL